MLKRALSCRSRPLRNRGKEGKGWRVLRPGSGLTQEFVVERMMRDGICRWKVEVRSWRELVRMEMEQG